MLMRASRNAEMNNYRKAEEEAFCFVSFLFNWFFFSLCCSYCHESWAKNFLKLSQDSGKNPLSPPQSVLKRLSPHSRCASEHWTNSAPCPVLDCRWLHLHWSWNWWLRSCSILRSKSKKEMDCSFFKSRNDSAVFTFQSRITQTDAILGRSEHFYIWDLSIGMWHVDITSLPSNVRSFSLSDC